MNGPRPQLVSLAATAVLAFAVGCTPKPPEEVDRARIDDHLLEPADRRFAAEPFSDQARAGVVRQRTLFEHHFSPGSAALTSLGEQDLAYLADAMRIDGGTIAVRRGSADDQLYRARLESVRRTLASRGIVDDRIALSGGLPGGPGIASGEALIIRERVREVPLDVPTGSILSPTGGESTVDSEMGGS